MRCLALALVDVPSQYRTEIVVKSYGNRRVSAHFNWKSDGRQEEPLRHQTIAVRFLSKTYHKNVKAQTITKS